VRTSCPLDVRRWAATRSPETVAPDRWPSPRLRPRYRIRLTDRLATFSPVLWGRGSHAGVSEARCPHIVIGRFRYAEGRRGRLPCSVIGVGRMAEGRRLPSAVHPSGLGGDASEPEPRPTAQSDHRIAQCAPFARTPMGLGPTSQLHVFGVSAMSPNSVTDVDIVLVRSRGGHPDVSNCSLSALSDCEGFAEHVVMC